MKILDRRTELSGKGRSQYIYSKIWIRSNPCESRPRAGIPQKYMESGCQKVKDTEQILGPAPYFPVKAPSADTDGAYIVS